MKARGGLERIAPLLRAPRYEVLPTPSAEQAVAEWLPRWRDPTMDCPRTSAITCG